MSRAIRYTKLSKSDIRKLKNQMKKTFTTLVANIGKLGYEEYNLISYDS